MVNYKLKTVSNVLALQISQTSQIPELAAML